MIGDTNGTVAGWYQPQPFLICLRCRAVYDRRQGEYRKLSSLSQTGRSHGNNHCGQRGRIRHGRPKVCHLGKPRPSALPTTDRDASLQAGHLNDFVQVAMLRAGVVKALRLNGALTFDRVGPHRSLMRFELRPHDFLLEPVDSGPGYDQGKRAMVDLLEYLVLEDLSRGWRITQPNLEQTGLLRIEYPGLAELASDRRPMAGSARNCRG